MRGRVRQRIERYYNWEWITAFYEDLFTRMLHKQPLIGYDAFLAGNRPGQGGS
jgi:hypothetical protein